MKKLICIILWFCTFCGLHAELNPPHRYFELGFDVDVAVANNWFPIGDFFQETLVVDFSEMSDKLKNGLDINFDVNANVIMNLNIGSIFRFGVFGGLDGTGELNLSQGLVDFLGKGNSSGNHSVEIGAGIDTLVYAQAGLSFQSFIKKIGFSFSPAVFLPVVYIPSTEIAVTATPVPGGGTVVKTNADVAMYSIIGIDQFTAIDINRVLNINNMGLDFSLGAEYPLFSFLDLGVSVKNIPIILGKLEYKTAISASFEYDSNELLDSLGNSNSEISKKSFPTVEMPEKSIHLNDAQVVRRPTLIGIAASYRPFGELFNVRGNLDFVINKPFYVNFNIGAGIHLLRMCKMGGHLFNLTLNTGYNQRMWTQQLDLVFNLRALELAFSVSSRSGNFIRSFMGAGLGVGVGFRLGF